MPSILPEYEYDIFISYRQNDNKRDKWVTQFVEALKDELEATLKNPVSIYFDENPHDGLLETHQVGESLEKKLKCLVFIPIISQTYCDTKSFAWSEEFLPFLKMAANDELGMNITLSNGNVASRVLPIRIHDLDNEDQALIGEKLGGPLRAIDFIYNEPGVNRPLKPQDKRELNQEKTSYQNQINKVANALKEIGKGVLRTNDVSSSDGVVPDSNETPIKRSNKIIAMVAIAAVLALGYWGYLNLFNQENKVSPVTIMEKGHKVIAVLPFSNTKPDPDNDYLGFAIASQVIGALDYNKNLTIRPSTDIRKYEQQVIDIKIVADDLKVDYVLTGNYLMVANIIRLNIEFIDANSNTSLWREKLEVDYKNAFDLQDLVAQKVVAGLDIQFSPKELKTIRMDVSADPLAYEYFLRGISYPSSVEGNTLAIEMFEKSIAIDSNYAPAYAQLGYRANALLMYGSTANRHQILPEEYLIKALEINENNLDALTFLSARMTERGKTGKAVETIKKALKINPNYSQALFYLGYIYRYAGMLDESIIEMEKGLALDPSNRGYRSLGITYYNIGDDMNAYRAFALDKGSSYELSWHVLISFRKKELEKTLELIDQIEAIDSSGLHATINRIIKAIIEEKPSEGLRWAKRMEELTTDSEGKIIDAEICYYIAGLYAGLGAKEDALRQLEITIENGYFNYPFMVNDYMFSSLREDEDYLAILSLAKEKHFAFKEMYFNN